MKNSLFRMVMAITLYTLAQVSFANPASDYNFTKTDINVSVELRAGSVGAIKIPVTALAKARVASVDGVVVNFDNGMGYIAIGDEKAVIFIVDNDQSNIIAQITTTNMSEKDIQTIILNGVIK